MHCQLLWHTCHGLQGCCTVPHGLQGKCTVPHGLQGCCTGPTLTRSALDATAVFSPAARHASTSCRAPLCSMPQPAVKAAGEQEEASCGAALCSFQPVTCVSATLLLLGWDAGQGHGRKMQAFHPTPAAVKRPLAPTWDAVLGQINLKEALLAGLHFKGGAILARHPTQKVGLAGALRCRMARKACRGR